MKIRIRSRRTTLTEDEALALKGREIEARLREIERRAGRTLDNRVTPGDMIANAWNDTGRALRTAMDQEFLRHNL